MKTFRTVVVMLVLVLAGVLAAQWMAGTDRDLGEVFIRFAGYDLHTNVPRAVLALLLAGGVTWLLWRGGIGRLAGGVLLALYGAYAVAATRYA